MANSLEETDELQKVSVSMELVYVKNKKRVDYDLERVYKTFLKAVPLGYIVNKFQVGKVPIALSR